MEKAVKISEGVQKHLIEVVQKMYNEVEEVCKPFGLSPTELQLHEDEVVSSKAVLRLCFDMDEDVLPAPSIDCTYGAEALIPLQKDGAFVSLTAADPLLTFRGLESEAGFVGNKAFSVLCLKVVNMAAVFAEGLISEIGSIALPPVMSILCYKDDKIGVRLEGDCLHVCFK